MFTDGRRTAAGLPPLAAAFDADAMDAETRGSAACRRAPASPNGPAGRWRQACASVREAPAPPPAIGAMK